MHSTDCSRCDDRAGGRYQVSWIPLVFYLGALGHPPPPPFLDLGPLREAERIDQRITQVGIHRNDPRRRC